MFSAAFRCHRIAPVMLAGLMAACASPEPGGFLDPYEAQNRRVHQVNRNIDETLLRPASNAYGGGVPVPVRDGVGNFAANLGLPGTVVNNLLQLDLEGAVVNSFRFAFNSTFGLGGVLDPATEMGLAEVETDFGETLYVWGVPQGNYMELPVIGPSTERHTAGRIVDLFTNPLSYAVDPPDSYVPAAAGALAGIGTRYEYGDSVDSVLYDSEDSYAQARSLYLQNRRFELGMEVTGDEADEIDAVFEQLYGE